MKRAELNVLIDILAFGCFIFLTATGVLLHYVLPEGSGYFRQIWGLDRHQWGTVHFWVSVVFLMVLALHLLLHWRWILNLAKPRSSSYSGIKAGLGATAFLALMALSIAPLFSPVVDYRQTMALDGIKASMTLAEVAAYAKVPASHLLKELNLPQDTSYNETLRVLKSRHDFTMSDVKKTLVRYKTQ